MSLKNSALNDAGPLKCKLAKIWTRLDDEDREILLAWIDRGIGGKKIAKELASEGYPIVQGSVTAHLQSECCCAEPDDVLYGRRPKGVL